MEHKIMQHKILVVDDEPIIRMDIREILMNEGYSVVGEAKNGEEAIQFAYQHQPDLIIMDVKMPVMNGIKAAAAIRKRMDASILLLTAYSQKELVQDACNAGVTAYLVKPVSEEDLLPAVKVALSHRNKERWHQQEVQELKRKFEDRKIVERAKGKIMNQFSFTEEEAHRWMQRQSMSKQISLTKFAEQLLAGEKSK